MKISPSASGTANCAETYLFLNFHCPKSTQRKFSFFFKLIIILYLHSTTNEISNFRVCQLLGFSSLFFWAIHKALSPCKTSLKTLKFYPHPSRSYVCYDLCKSYSFIFFSSLKPCFSSVCCATDHKSPERCLGKVPCGPGGKL